MFFSSPGISSALPLFVAPQQQQQQQLQGASTGSYATAAGVAHAQQEPDGLLSPAVGLASASSAQLQAALGAPVATTAAEQQQQQHNHAITSAFGFMPGRQLSYPSPLPEYSLLDDQPLQLPGLHDLQAQQQVQGQAAVQLHFWAAGLTLPQQVWGWEVEAAASTTCCWGASLVPLQGCCPQATPCCLKLCPNKPSSTCHPPSLAQQRKACSNPSNSSSSSRTSAQLCSTITCSSCSNSSSSSSRCCPARQHQHSRRASGRQHSLSNSRGKQARQQQQQRQQLRRLHPSVLAW
ncbi:hypothetical protein COO60DRAFT_177506 [Scenedesmus sp. NREL 46B-D3]|nr:hypothetical protein COO60DRAFT_177506 [Scenedesmus sp. NREL 46B-D3]